MGRLTRRPNRPSTLDMTGPEDYSILNSSEIETTIDALWQRISERFPESGLSSVGRRLLDISRHAAERSRLMNRPVYWLRFLSIAVISLMIGVCLDIPWLFSPHRERLDWVEAVELLEPAMNIVVLIGALVYFFISLERRFKRAKALEAIHELRSVAHIIDMHQLTKDPEALISGLPMTSHSPKSHVDEVRVTAVPGLLQ